MLHFEYLLLPLVAFLAYFLKAMTGFGPAIVLISLGSLFIGPQSVVVTSSILDIIAGVILLSADWEKGSYRFWIPLAVAIVFGTAVGTIFLKIIPPEKFHILLSIAILVLGVWFMIGRSKTNISELQSILPEKCKKTDAGFTFIGGFCGGLFGISGPPIIWNFGRQLAKRAFRQVLIPIFVIAAITRVAMYSSMGIVNWQVLKYVVVALPGLLLGLFFGNKIFFTLSEIKFCRVVGALLFIVALKLFFSNV